MPHSIEFLAQSRQTSYADLKQHGGPGAMDALSGTEAFRG
jgi:hypothetical protein